MKVLIVCSGNFGYISPFIKDQADSIIKHGIEIDFYTIIGHGITGYLSNIKKLKLMIASFRPDLIHAHYGLSGLLAAIQREIPVVVTFHGSDINAKKNLIFSYLAFNLSAGNIFVNPGLQKKFHAKQEYPLIPCGVDLSVFYPVASSIARKELGMKENQVYVLFSSQFDNPIKNYLLAKNALELSGLDAELLELKGFSRKEVNLLMNASNLLLLTSFSEASPMVAKEAMACNCPVVATEVGDIKWLFGNEPGHYVTGFDPNDVAAKINASIDFSEQTGHTAGRKRIIELGLDSETIAKKIISVYESVLQKRK